MAYQQYTLDTFESTCQRCGGKVTYRRRGRVSLINSTHLQPDGSTCPALAWQEDVLRTNRVFQTINQGHTPAKLQKELELARRTY